MLEETGLPALGYARPQNDEILLVDGLSKAVEKEVLAHEAEHIQRGEEGPLLGSVVSAFAGPVIGGLLGVDDAAGEAAKVSARGSQAALAENRRQFDLATLVNVLLNLPSINAGNIARSQLLSEMGLSTPETDLSGITDGLGGANSRLADALGQLQTPGSSPIAPSALSETIMNTPGAQFLVDETTDNILGRNAALGLREAGVTAKNISQDVSNRVLFPLLQDRQNRLASLAGGGTSTSGGLAGSIGTLATNAGGLNSALIQNAADARASGILGDAGQKNLFANSIGGALGDLIGSGKSLFGTGKLGSIIGGMMG